MRDKELYQHILGLTSPWTVSSVKLDIPAEEIQVRVEHPPGTKFCCPECQKEPACYDHAEERRWRHLDSFQYKRILIGRVPRVDCPEHGVKTVKNSKEVPEFFPAPDPSTPLLSTTIRQKSISRLIKTKTRFWT
jgi:hypothetical protein